MRHSLVLVAGVCVLAAATAGWSETPAEPLPAGAVVTLSFNAAVMATAEARRDFASLQTKFAPRQTQVQSLNDEVEGVRKQLSTGTDKLSETEKSAREQALNAKEKRLQREAEDLRNDWQAESQQAFEHIAQKAYGVLQSYARDNHYAMVVDRGTDAAPVVWFAAANVDITEAFVKAYDAQAGVTAPPAPASRKGTGTEASPRPTAPVPAPH